MRKQLIYGKQIRTIVGVNCRYCIDVPAGSYCDECGVSCRAQPLQIGQLVTVNGVNGVLLSIDASSQTAQVMVDGGSRFTMQFPIAAVVPREIVTHDNPVQLSNQCGIDYSEGGALEHTRWRTCTLPMGHSGAHGQNPETPLTNAVAEIQAADTRQGVLVNGSRQSVVLFWL